MAGEAGRGGLAQELLHQPRLADAGLAPDIDRLAAARLTAGRQRRC